MQARTAVSLPCSTHRRAIISGSLAYLAILSGYFSSVIRRLARIVSVWEFNIIAPQHLGRRTATEAARAAMCEVRGGMLAPVEYFWKALFG